MDSATTIPADFHTLNGAFQWSIQQLRNGIDSFYLDSDILAALGGDHGMACLVQMLNVAMGFEVRAEYQPEPAMGHVYVPKEKEPQLPLPSQVSAETSLPEIPKQTTGSGGRKNPPRPMNCWMLYRDAHHKQLKATMPDLTVQEISTRLSDQWKKLPAEEKDYWREQAKLAKEEHQRMFPDYKYAPRKPGQKKKRQTRKARVAAAAASSPETSMAVSDFNAVPEATTSVPINSAPAMGFGPEVFDFNAFPDNSMLAPDTDPIFGAATSYFTTDIGNALPDDAAEFADILSAPMPFADLHDAEARRHEQLENEFEAYPDFYRPAPLDVGTDEDFDYSAYFQEY